MSDMSAGQIVGGVVGAVVGWFVTYTPAGVAQGFALGAGIGGYIDPPPGPNLRGPTLSDKSFQSTAYGTTLPDLHGAFATMGSIIYLENNEYKAVAKKESQGGKGGGGATVTTTTYYATFAVAVSKARPGSAVRRIWAGGKLIYSAGSGDSGTLIQSQRNASGWRYYDGSQTEPDSRMESVLGVGNCPSYEGTAYIIFYDFDLTDYGNGLSGCPMKVETIPNKIDYGDFNDLALMATIRTAFGGSYQGACSALKPANNDLSVFSSAHRFINASPQRPWAVAFKTRQSSGNTTTVTIDNVDFIDGNPVLGYSEKSTQGYRKIRQGTGPYSKWFVGGSEYSLPSEFFNPSGFLMGDFQRVFEFSAGNFFVIATYSSSTFLDPSSNYFWRYGDSPTHVFKIPNAYSIEATVVIGGEVWFYDEALSRYKKYLLSDYSFVGDLIFTEPGGVDVQVAGYRDGYIYHVNTSNTEFKSGNIHLHQINTVSGEIKKKSFVVPAPSNHLNSGTKAGLFLGDSTLFVSCTDGADAVMFYSFLTGSNGGADDLLERSGVKLSDLVQGIYRDAGIPSEYLDVTALVEKVQGYRVDGGSPRGALAPLQVAYLFDMVEVGYKAKAIKRGSAGAEIIPFIHLGAHPSGGEPGAIVNRDMDMSRQVPQRYGINYIDYNREYDSNVEYGEYPANSRATRNEQIPIVISSDKAAQLADILVNLSWIERDIYKFSLPQIYLGLIPSDERSVEVLPGNFVVMRIESISYTQDQRLDVVARRAEFGVYQSTATGSVIEPPSENIPLISDSVSLLLDIPMMLDSLDFPGVVGTMYGEGTWPGGVLLQSTDNGQTFVDKQAFINPGTVGAATNSLSAHDGFVLDRTSVLNINERAGSFYSVTEEQMMTGKNYIAYGVDGRWEIMRFVTAEIQVDGSVNLSIFARGLKGTEWATGLHQADDLIVLLDDPDNAFIGLEVGALLIDRLYKGVTIGQNATDANSFTFSYDGINLKPLSPVLAEGELVSDDWIINWIPRTRYASTFWVTGNQPQNEAVMSWDIDIYNGSAVVRTLTSTAASVTYLEADQIADFGSVQTSIDIAIYQRSQRVGRGYGLRVLL